MEGDLTQLKANDYDSLDKYLSISDDNVKNKVNNNRIISLFESNFTSYKKPINFIVNSRKVYSNTSFDFGNKVQFTIPRYGDKISNVYLEIKLPILSDIGYVNTIGYAMIEYIEIEIGGHIIDKHYDIWMDVRDKLMINKNYINGVNEMIKRYSSHTDESFRGGTVIIPLNFWFCNSLSQSFPLIALSHQDMHINVKFREFSQLWISNESLTPSTTPSIESGHLIIDYIRLDKLERHAVYNKKRHEYLIKQVQLVDEGIPAGATKAKICLNSINYPVIELVWVIRKNSRESEKDYYNYEDTTTANDDPMLNARITFGEKERLEEHSSNFFRMIQPNKIHSNIPNDYVYMYSFAIKPEYDSQPTGSCNFSSIDDIFLQLGMKTGISASKVYVFAVNYNILIIEDGYAWVEKCLSI